jgi:RHS repeat-associated protein
VLEWFSVHTDQLGAPRALSNSAGKMVWRWFSQPFGEGVVNSDVDADGRSVTFNLRFPGQYFDWDTKLHYNYFRNYDVNTGKYIESDPIGLEGGINTYGYGLQNSIQFSDLLGLDVQINLFPNDDPLREYVKKVPSIEGACIVGGGGTVIPTRWVV